MPTIELVDTFDDASLEMGADGNTFRVAQALQEAIAAPKLPPLVMVPFVSGPVTVTPGHVYLAMTHDSAPAALSILTLDASLVPATIHGQRLGIYAIGGVGAPAATFMVSGGSAVRIQNPRNLTGPLVTQVTLSYVGYAEWAFDKNGNAGAGLWRVVQWIDNAPWIAGGVLEAGGLALQIGAIPASRLLRRADSGTELKGSVASMDDAGNITGAGKYNNVVPCQVSSATPTALVPGAVGAAGAATDAAKSGHSHSLPGFGNTAGMFCEGSDSRLSNARVPLSHAFQHAKSGADELNVTNLTGKLADPQTPLAHKASHQFGGADAINVQNLSGRLADPQVADALKTATGFVTISSVAPTPDQVLVANATDAAGWRTVNLAFRGNQCRLSGESANPVMVGQNANIGTLYFLPFIGDLIGLYGISGVPGWKAYQIPSAGISRALSGLTTGRPHDVFVNATTGAAEMEFLAWASTTARATGLTLTEGVYVKSGDTSRRYVGTIFARSSTTISFINGEPAKCDIWNVDNRVLASFNSGAPWSAGGSSVNTVNVWQPFVGSSWCELVLGLIGRGDVITGRMSIMVATNGGNNAQAGPGWDSTTGTNGEQPQISGLASGITVQLISESRIVPNAIGTHYVAYLIRASNTAVKFFWQDSWYSGSFRTDLFY